MVWKFIHTGYYTADGDYTDDNYVVRTRPKNDGWMAINEEEGIVLATGLSLFEARETCASYDKHVSGTFVTVPADPDPIRSLRDSDESFEALIASYHTR